MGNMMKPFRTAIKMFAMMTLLLGVAYPIVINLIAQLTMPKRAGGSLIYAGEKVIGSQLLAQNFKDETYFHPRPSAIDFDPMKPSGGSNLGPTSQKLKEAVEARAKKLGPNPPAQLVYASGSGIDPH